jgi:hypothetical protein
MQVSTIGFDSVRAISTRGSGCYSEAASAVGGDDYFKGLPGCLIGIATPRVVRMVAPLSRRIEQSGSTRPVHCTCPCIPGGTRDR